MSDADPVASSPVTTVLVVDDHPLFLEGLRGILSLEPGLQVVGEAASGEEAIELAAARSPDVVVMDLHLPDLSGVEATRRIMLGKPEARVLVLTMVEDDESVVAALRAGACGYVLKESRRAEIIRAVQAVAAGQSVFDRSVAHRVIGYIAGGARAPEPAFPELTVREREILALVAEGRDNQFIARHLFLSAKTVRNHISHIFTKLAVTTRAEAIVRARGAGIRSDL